MLGLTNGAQRMAWASEMIVVTVTLHSAVDGRVETLATAIINNIGGTQSVADCQVRAWPKGAPTNPTALLRERKPHRNGVVRGHRRSAEPVWSLVSKALTAMGYGND